MGKRVVRRQTVPTKSAEAGNLTDDVAARRKREIEDNFPRLNPGDYANDKEFREALLEQYRAMRQQEYQYVCLNEGLKAYDVSVSICSRTGNKKAMNKATWNGCADIMRRYPDMKEAVADSCYARIPQYVTKTLSGRTASCCAVSSKALESKISAEMGFDDADNFVQPYQKYPEAKHYRLANGFMDDPALEGYTARGDLWTLISEGKVGPGATIGIPSHTDSGYHAKTVIAVNYDENGNLKNYVLQANNSNNLEVVTSRVLYSNVIAGDMNRWMTKQMNDELDQYRELSTTDLARMVSREREKLGTRVDDLEKTENHLFTAQGRNNKVIQYADSYVKNANVPSATPAVMRIDGENAGEEASRQERRFSMFYVTAATNEQRESSAIQAEQPAAQAEAQAEASSEKKVVRTDEISDKDKARMESMLNNLNKVSKKNPVDIEATIDRLAELYGTDASKVLTKIMMSPSQFSQRLDLRNENGKRLTSSRDVLEQLCQIDNEEQNQQILAIAATKRRGRGGMA